MDSRAPMLLLLGLAAWLTVIPPECQAAARRGRFYPQDEGSISSSPQEPTKQDSSSSRITGKDSGANEQPTGTIGSSQLNIRTPTKGEVIPDEKIIKSDNGAKSSLITESSKPVPDEEGTEEEDENGIIRGKYTYIEEDGIPVTIEYEAGPGMKFAVKNYMKGSNMLPIPSIGRALFGTDKNQRIKELQAAFHSTGNVGIGATDNMKRGRTLSKPENDSPNPADTPSDQNKEPTSNTKTKSTHNMEFIKPDVLEDGIEEEDENGVIRGKYSYVEEDGVPATIEYEAGPGMRFLVKNYIKGSKLLPVTNILEIPATGRAINTKYSDEKPEHMKNIKQELLDVPTPNKESITTGSSGPILEDPVYEHSAVLTRHYPKLNRKTRTLNDQTMEQQTTITYLPPPSEHKSSKSDPAVVSGLDSKSEQDIEQDKTQSDDTPINASYRFGFSADGQTRNEEADAEGNVQGSYSYIDGDGLLTKVEYEAGSGKGFVVKRITQEDVRRSLDNTPKSTDATSLNQPPEMSNPQVLSTPLVQSNEKLGSYENKHFQLQNENPSKAVNSQQNEEVAGMNRIKNDGSYSFSYMTPDQMREESADSNGYVKGMFSYITHGNDNRKQLQQEAGSEKGFITTDYNSPLIQMSPLTTKPIPTSISKQNLNENNFKINNDGSYSFSYETPDQVRAEYADTKGNVQGHYSFLPNKKDIVQEKNHVSLEGQGFLAVQGHDLNQAQDDSAPLDDDSSVKNDGSYSYSYETSDQSRHEAGDVGGNVQGQYSYVADDGIRRTVHYKASPEEGFTAEASHFPSTTNNVGSDSKNIAEENKISPGGKINENPAIYETASSIGHVKDLSTGEDHIAQKGSTIMTKLGFSPQDISEVNRDSPQVILDLSGIRRGVAVKENGRIHKQRKVIKKRPLQATSPNFSNSLPGGSYSFSYKTKDQLRKESVDTTGNVYSSYQYNTKNNGRAVVVFIRKSGKDPVNEDDKTSSNIFKTQANHVQFEYPNEDTSYHSLDQTAYYGGNSPDRRRHVQGVPDHSDGHRMKSVQPMMPIRDSKVNVDSKPSLNGDINYKHNPTFVNTEENAQSKSYRSAKSISKPFRGNMRYQRKII